MEKETFISKEEILQALKENNEKIFERADETRKVFCKDEVHIRGIIAFSNYCCRSCLYCGLRKENKQIFRYRMKPEEIVKVACEIIQNGVKTVVLQSGDDFGFSRKTLVEIINKIKKGNNVAITLSVGEKPFDDYKAFREAGADRFLLKHETSNQSLYGKLHPGQSLKERLKSLEYMKKLGYQIGAGNIIGLPGQSIDDLVNDILFLKEFDVDMAGIGPFIPQKDTPLGNYPAGDLNLTLKFHYNQFMQQKVILQSILKLISLFMEIILIPCNIFYLIDLNLPQMIEFFKQFLNQWKLCKGHWTFPK